jgi:signal transduction histidine kinase
MVSLREVDHGLNPSIQDDFIGFDTAEVRKKPGLGLSNMRERVRIIQGVLRITSEPEKGTTIEVKVPLKRGTNMTET